MNSQRIFELIIPRSSLSGVAGLINNILVLEERVNAPELQSEYFRWGYESQVRRLAVLKDRYKNIRKEFNAMGIDEIIACREKSKKFLETIVPTIQPLFARAIMRSSTHGTIWKLDDYMKIKSIVSALPTIDELRNDLDFLMKILG